MARRTDTELVTFGRSRHTHLEPDGLRITTLQALTWLNAHPAQPVAPSLIGALRGASVVHTHHMRSLPSKMAVLVGRTRRVPVAVTDHGLPGSTWRGLLPRLFDLFLTVSAYSARELQAPADRTRLIYGGADPERFAPDPNQARHGVLFVGRLTPHKGVDRLLAALPPNASARIAGSEGHDPLLPERNYPALLRRLAHDRSVEFLGPVRDADLPALYRSAQVFVLPSVAQTCYGKHIAVSELLGLSVLEAMASGTPVIVSAIGGVPEIVRDGETGFLVPPGDVHALRDRMQRLLQDPTLAARLGSNARQHVLERFTWRHVAERCLEAYAQTAST
jgi:alpha-maltose-1-phosphate synthase